MELESLDRRILAELDRNCRASNSEIARKLRINKNVVSYRLKNLEKNGTIRGYYAIIDTYKLGYSSYRAYLKLQYASPETQAEMMDYLVSVPSVWWAGFTHGHFNIGILVWVRNQKEFVDFWADFNAKFRDNVGEAVVSIYHGLEQYRLPFAKELMKGQVEPDAIGVGETVKIDHMDAELLKLIAADARMPLLDIAKRMGVTPAAVRYRLKLLLKKRIIVAFRVNVAMDKLGYTLYKADFNLKDMSAYPKMIEYARQSPNIYYVDKSIGLADCEIELYAKSPAEFYDALAKIRLRFADSIRDFDFFAYSKITKLLYVPADLKSS
ncbi:MAG: winged helix-turn-helix transcriptional regulator [Candidatus Anstonellaceae archaeon]